MPKWPAGTTDFAVSVVANVQADTSYSYIPKPILNKLGNPKRLVFSIRGDTVTVDNADR